MFKGSEEGQKGDKALILCLRLTEGGGQSQTKWTFCVGEIKRGARWSPPVDILSGAVVFGWLGGRPGGFGGLSSFDVLSQVSSDLESRKCFAESSDLIDSHRGIGVVF